jgi:Ser/Thr protein kinase RdoA (MazF antagonist)
VEASILELVERAHEATHDRRRITAVEEMSAMVSTNSVFRLTFEDGKERIAKVSSYGSFVHFRQDHERIATLIAQLRHTRFASFLAPVLLKSDGRVFLHREDRAWVVFYEKVPFYDFLPPRLEEGHIDALGHELAEFHRACAAATVHIAPTWKSLGSDVALLFDKLGSESYRTHRGLSTDVAELIRRHCETFLENAESLGYHGFKRIPVLVDWNIGNFSVGMDAQGFKFFSRWDYDWFRIEPRTLDFYFCSRVVRDEGDQSTFSYLSSTLFEPRFVRFLRAYHAVSPLDPNEIRFLVEAYRFFVLNYVLLEGHHFFRPAHCQRLQREAIEIYLPALDRVSAEPLVDALFDSPPDGQTAP